VILAVIVLVAYGLSRAMQQQITRPVLALADTARRVSEHGDFSVRAPRIGKDEVGQLADSFNLMLSRIGQQDQALRQHENQLQTIIENLAEGLAVADLNGRFLHFNRAALQLHGFSSVEEGGRDMHEIERLFELSTLDGKVLPPEQRPLPRILRGEQLHDWQVRIRRRHSEWQRVFSYGGLLVKDGAQKPMMAIVTISDITERKQADEEIRQLNNNLERRVAERTAELETANKELESFSYSVSHDLRAPLRHIDGFAQLLQKRMGANLAEIDQRYLNNITNSAKGLGLLIDELLAFSRMGRAEMRQIAVNVREMVEETRKEFLPEQQQRQIQWRIGDLPVIEADPAMLRQVWRNLIGNAIKYTRQREVATIEISHQVTERDGHVFAVRDNGAGFDMQYADKLFGVFQRLHHANEFEGTGIGLANVRRIVYRHGGRTWAEGQVGVGATFYVALPNGRRPATAPTLSS
jgi:PAS domain S-box-containing protein